MGNSIYGSTNGKFFSYLLDSSGFWLRYRIKNFKFRLDSTSVNLCRLLHLKIWNKIVHFRVCFCNSPLSTWGYYRGVAFQPLENENGASWDVSLTLDEFRPPFGPNLTVQSLWSQGSAVDELGLLELCGPSQTGQCFFPKQWMEAAGHQMLCCFPYCFFLHTQYKVSRHLCNLIAESACPSSWEMGWQVAQVTPYSW